MIYLKYILLIVINAAVYFDSQAQQILEITVLDSISRVPIQYVEVFNITSENGTSTDAFGKAVLLNNNSNDVIKISLLGYEEKSITFSGNKRQHLVLLKPKEFHLSEITISAKNDYLYHLIRKAGKTKSEKEEQSRAYLLLKTEYQNDTVEIIEAYYNANVSGHKLDKLTIKNGRVGLRQYKEGGYFVSLSTTNLLMKYEFSESHDEFPKNPFNISLNEMKENYQLNLITRFKDNDYNFVEIEFVPISDSIQYFKGNVIINESLHQVANLELLINNAAKHALQPIWPEDSLANVSMKINYGFQYHNKNYRLNSINLEYGASYYNLENQIDSFIISSRAALNLYNFNNLFIMPEYTYGEQAYQRDYRQLNAIPYNDYFWKEISEFRINTDKNALELFFNNTKVETNKTLFLYNAIQKDGFFQHPYLHWSPKRIILKEASEETIFEKSLRTTYVSDLYKFNIQIYFDCNVINDSISFQTAVIFDQYNSFYHMKHNNNTNKFINIYFDLFEVYRRKLQKQIQDLSYEKAREKYIMINDELSRVLSRFLKEVDLGYKDIAMKNWSQYVLQELGIDNYSSQ